MDLNFWFPILHTKILEVVTLILTTRKKFEQTENQRLFLDSSGSWGYRGNSDPKIWRDGQIQKITAKITLPEAEVAGGSNW